MLRQEKNRIYDYCKKHTVIASARFITKHFSTNYHSVPPHDLMLLCFLTEILLMSHKHRYDTNYHTNHHTNHNHMASIGEDCAMVSTTLSRAISMLCEGYNSWVPDATNSTKEIFDGTSRSLLKVISGKPVVHNVKYLVHEWSVQSQLPLGAYERDMLKLMLIVACRAHIAKSKDGVETQFEEEFRQKTMLFSLETPSGEASRKELTRLEKIWG